MPILFLLGLLLSSASALTGSGPPTRRVMSRRAALLAVPAFTALPREAFGAATGGGFSGSGLAPQDKVKMPKELATYMPPPSKKGVPSMDELERLSIGYQRLKFLLDNWEAETTVCIKGCKGKWEACGCERSPVVVQSYMGFKSMNDPLFKADALMIRAEPLAEKQFEKYAALVDRWVEKADDGNVMAYVSSWGEANPGGGQSEVARYLEKSRKGVVESADILKQICDILGVPTTSA